MDYLEEAKRLINLPQSCMKKEDASVMLLLHPKHAANVKKGIVEELDTMLQRYSETLNGIPMAYENIKLLSNYGVLLHDNAYAHVHVSATFYVFTPEIGSVLPGVACKKSVNHIGFLVYNKFNVAAMCPDGVSHANWCGSQVHEQDEVKITVTYLNMKGYVPTIKVQIDPDSIPDHSSPSVEISTNTQNKRIVFNDDDSGISSNDTPVTKVKKKKRKSRLVDKSDIKMEDNDSTSEEDTREKKKKLKKKLFKSIVPENSNLDISLERKEFLTPDSVLDSPTKKKKKKRKSLLEDSPTISAETADDSLRDEGEGSFLSSPSKKKKKSKLIKEELDSSSVDLDSLKPDLNDSTLLLTKKKKKDKKSKDNSFSMGDLETDSPMPKPLRKFEKENLDSSELDLEDSLSSAKKKKHKKSDSSQLDLEDLSLSPAKKKKHKKSDSSELDLEDSSLSPAKKKKDKKSKETSLIGSFDTPINKNVTPVIKKMSAKSSSKSHKKAEDSLKNDLEDLPLDFDTDMFESPPTKTKKSKKQKSESSTSQSLQKEDKKRKAEETPDGIKSKKRRKT